LFTGKEEGCLFYQVKFGEGGEEWEVYTSPRGLSPKGKHLTGKRIWGKKKKLKDPCHEAAKKPATGRGPV